MNYKVRAIFYRSNDEPDGDEQGTLLGKFQAESDEKAVLLMKERIADRPAFSRVFRLYRAPSPSPIHEIIKPSGYEVDGLYDDGDGGQEHHIFDAFDAKDEAEARQKVLERSAGKLAARYRCERVVQLYRVPFHHETAKPFEDWERVFLGNVDIRREG